MAEKKAAPILGATAFKPVERHGWEAVKYFIHNPETGEYFTRTPKSWALITGFYIIYYSCLAAFWAAMLMIFFTTLRDDQPKWMAGESLIGVSPGVGLRPKQPNQKDHLDSTIILYSIKHEKDTADFAGYGPWVNSTKTFLDTYKADGRVCDSANPVTKDKDGGCRFDLSELKDCVKDGYGFKEGAPCLFLKLNRIMDLENDHYNDMDDPNLPEDFPENLKAHINSQTDKEQVWVNCQGEYPADKEALGDPEYFPKSRGFPGYFFPYMNQKNYQSPLVAVRFPNAKKNQLLHVECRVWAWNIGYSRRDRIGINHFELLIQEPQE